VEFNYTIKVFDFFSGCGGTSKGFSNSGLDIVFAIDNDRDSGKSFNHNFPNTHFELYDINEYKSSQLKPWIDKCKGHPILFSGCAPCQPFTKQNTRLKKIDDRKELLVQFERFVTYYKPHFVFIENVPGLQNIDKNKGPFNSFVSNLDRLGYYHNSEVVSSMAYGVPQKRKRLVLIASLLGTISFPDKTNGPGSPNPEYSSVRDWIGHLPAIEAGEVHETIFNHRASALSELNLMRIRATPVGGDRRCWPKELQLQCHTNGYKGHTDVYGRMHWDQPATGLTTRCDSLSNGRFGHPDQDRAISIREAACLQMFPEDFIFYGSKSSMSRQIGNAVPVGIAEIFGNNFKKHLENHRLKKSIGKI